MPRFSLPPRRQATLVLLLLIAGATTFVPGADAAGERSILGADGQPVRLLQDAYGELFPIGSEASPRSSVLALEQRTADGRLARSLVPGTSGPDEEVEYSLLLDKTSASVFVFWESRLEGSAALRLARFDTAFGWSEDLELSGDPSSWKSAPELAVTRDSLPGEPGSLGEGSPADHRSVLHLLWAEQGAEGDRVRFAPVVILNGAYVGSHPVLDLAEFLTDTPEAATPRPALSLIEAPALLPGQDDRTVIIAFTDPETRRLVTLKVVTLPAQLSALAGVARANITVLGGRSTIQSIADLARANITVLGQRLRFHPAVVAHVAERAYEALLAAGNQPGAADLEHLGQVAWSEIVRTAAGFEDRGLMGSGSDAEASGSKILELAEPDAADGTSSPPQLLQIGQIASWPAPATPELPTRVFVSPSGRDVLVAWQEEGRLEYRETEEGAWSEVKHLEFSSTLSPAAAYELLKHRVRSGG